MSHCPTVPLFDRKQERPLAPYSLGIVRPLPSSMSSSSSSGRNPADNAGRGPPARNTRSYAGARREHRGRQGQRAQRRIIFPRVPIRRSATTALFRMKRKRGAAKSKAGEKSRQGIKQEPCRRQTRAYFPAGLPQRVRPWRGGRGPPGGPREDNEAVVIVAAEVATDKDRHDSVDAPLPPSFPVIIPCRRAVCGCAVLRMRCGKNKGEVGANLPWATQRCLGGWARGGKQL